MFDTPGLVAAGVVIGHLGGHNFATKRRSSRASRPRIANSGNKRLNSGISMRASIFLSLIALSLAAVACSRAKPVGLAVDGYNYTNRIIVSFTVTDENGNGAGGGDIALSTPTAGGGKSTCCVMLESTVSRPVRLRINWTIDRIDDQTGCRIVPETSKEAWIYIAPPFPKNPNNLEVHFYPDGHVEAAVTHWSSPPRISLPEGRRPTM